MAYNPEMVLGIVKARLNRLASDTSLDGYFTTRMAAADAELSRKGVALERESPRDQALLADTVVWQYSNRDKPGATPEWLRLALRERWLQQAGDANDP